MKKIFKLMMLVVLSVVFSISLFAKDVVYVGTNAEFAPFEYLEKNQVVGFDLKLKIWLLMVYFQLFKQKKLIWL